MSQQPVKKSADSFTRQAEPVKKTPISSVEIVPARRAGVTGYANVGRGSLLGNPFIAGEPLSVADCVTAYRLFFSLSPELQAEARKILTREWPGGVVRLGCPCNGVEKGQPCHATVIKEFLEAEIARRSKP